MSPPSLSRAAMSISRLSQPWILEPYVQLLVFAIPLENFPDEVAYYQAGAVLNLKKYVLLDWLIADKTGITGYFAINLDWAESLGWYSRYVFLIISRNEDDMRLPSAPWSAIKLVFNFSFANVALKIEASGDVGVETIRPTLAVCLWDASYQTFFAMWYWSGSASLLAMFEILRWLM